MLSETGGRSWDTRVRGAAASDKDDRNPAMGVAQDGTPLVEGGDVIATHPCFCMQNHE